MFRIRFRLITLFIAMTFVATGAAVSGLFVRQVVAEHRALKAISAKGGLGIDYIHISNCTCVNFPTGRWRISCPGLAARTYLPETSSITFNDDDLQLLDEIRNLQHVDFRNTQVSAAAIERFKQSHPQVTVDP